MGTMLAAVFLFWRTFNFGNNACWSLDEKQIAVLQKEEYKEMMSFKIILNNLLILIRAVRVYLSESCDQSPAGMIQIWIEAVESIGKS